MTLAGAPDFQSQQAPTFTSLGTLTINGAAPVTLDVGPLIQPNHQGIMLVWVAALASAGSPILADITLGLSSLPIMDPTDIGDGNNVIAAIMGSLVTDNATTCVVEIQPSPSGVSPVTGSVFIFGITNPPLVIPTIRRAYIGSGTARGNVIVAAGTTVTVVPAAPTGKYNRIKSLYWRSNGVGTANRLLSWNDLGSGSSFAFDHSTGTNISTGGLTLDMENLNGVSFTNGDTTEYRVTAGWELWDI